VLYSPLDLLQGHLGFGELAATGSFEDVHRFAFSIKDKRELVKYFFSPPTENFFSPFLLDIPTIFTKLH